MYILYTDETNLERSKEAKFFIYGGIFFPIERLPELDKEIKKIREEAGYQNGEEFKFDTRSKPKRISKKNFDNAKNKVLDLCFDKGVQFIAYLVLHKIASEREKKITFAIDHVIGRFNQFLEEAKDYGICILDRLPDAKYQFRYIKKKFQHGLTFDWRSNLKLDRIKSFSLSCIGASNIGSIVDIVIGSFIYCVYNPKNKKVARYLMKKVIRLMWHLKEGENVYLLERGLILRPKRIRHRDYEIEYETLINQLNSLLKSND